MILDGMSFISADNSGAKILKCIQILGSSYKRKVKLNTFVKIIAKKISFNKKVKKKIFYMGIPTTLRSKLIRKDGSFVCGDRNKILTYTESYKFCGTRIYGYIFKELQLNSILKLKSPKMIKYFNNQL